MADTRCPTLRLIFSATYVSDGRIMQNPCLHRKIAARDDRRHEFAERRQRLIIAAGLEQDRTEGHRERGAVRIAEARQRKGFGEHGHQFREVPARRMNRGSHPHGMPVHVVVASLAGDRHGPFQHGKRAIGIAAPMLEAALHGQERGAALDALAPDALQQTIDAREHPALEHGERDHFQPRRRGVQISRVEDVRDVGDVVAALRERKRRAPVQFGDVCRLGSIRERVAQKFAEQRMHGIRVLRSPGNEESAARERPQNFRRIARSGDRIARFAFENIEDRCI